MYDDDDKLKDGARHLVANGIKVSDVYSPMPIHGIDPIIGVQPTRLAITAFLYGITGTMLAVIGIRYMMILDWPMNIGGKTNNSICVLYALSFYSAGLFRGGFCEQRILTYYFWGGQFQSHKAKIFPKRFLIKNTLCNTRPVVVLRSIIASVNRIDRVNEHLFTAFTLKLSLLHAFKPQALY